MIHGTRFLVLLGASIALGYGLRVAARSVEENAAQTSSRTATSHSHASDADQSVTRQKSSRPTTEEITLTKQQWSKVLLFPNNYRLSLKTLRAPSTIAGRDPQVVYHSQYLYGWSDGQTARMYETIRTFKQAVDALEAERAIVGYPEPGKVLINYGPMAEEYRRLIDDLRSEIQGILGEAKANKFLAVSDFNGMAAERGPDTRQEIAFALDDKQDIQITTVPKPDGIKKMEIGGMTGSAVFGDGKEEKPSEPTRVQLWDITMPVKIDMRRIEQDVRTHQIRTP